MNISHHNCSSNLQVKWDLQVMVLLPLIIILIIIIVILLLILIAYSCNTCFHRIWQAGRNRITIQTLKEDDKKQTNQYQILHIWNIIFLTWLWNSFENTLIFVLHIFKNDLLVNCLTMSIMLYTFCQPIKNAWHQFFCWV